MCGIAGFFSTNTPETQRAASLSSMLKMIESRGPDGQGMWHDSSGISLGHQRLAIIDLSEAGKQPMTSANGQWTVTFNGEIYNFNELRAELSQYQFRGHSDTEVLLAGFQTWGFAKTLSLCRGMWAIAAWHAPTKTLYLARDRMGEKPLYYGYSSGTFMFGSQLKALFPHPHWKGRIDATALALFFKYNYVPAPHSIFENIYKLKAGHFLEIRDFTSLPTSQPYWQLKNSALSQAQHPVDETRLISQTHDLLRKVVKEQMVSDVPIGAFLSGGIDSSTIVAVMQEQSAQPIQTFTIGFSSPDYDESSQAGSVASHLKTNHTEVILSEKDLLSLVPDLADIYDEPFSDSSQLPTSLLAKITRQHVKVSLSGDGGDELFGGYNRYIWAPKVWSTFSKAPQWSRRGLSKLFSSLPEDLLSHATSKVDNLGHKLHKLAAVLDFDSQVDLYDKLCSHWTAQNPALSVATQKLGSPQPLGLKDYSEEMMYLDSMAYLPDDIMVKVDRATMAVSLESRTPFLDQQLVEFIWRTPIESKVKGHQSKWLLRQVLNSYLPKELWDRPKKGFSVPMGRWLNHELKSWAQELLADENLKKSGLINLQVASNPTVSPLLKWDLLMFQAWYLKWQKYISI